jgi:hypothetical protein
MGRATKTKTISLEAKTLRKGIRLAEKRGFKNSFSAYIADRIEADDRALNGSEIRIPQSTSEVEVPV